MENEVLEFHLHHHSGNEISHSPSFPQTFAELCRGGRDGAMLPHPPALDRDSG